MSSADAPGSSRSPRARWRLPSRTRWLLIWLLIALWIVGLAFDWGGNLVHLILVLAIALLVLELLTDRETGDLLKD